MSEAVNLQASPSLDLESLAADVVKQAMKAGASDAEVVVREGDEFSVNVRMGQVETLKESGSRALGLRVYLGKRSASASTSDLTSGRDPPAGRRRDGAGQGDGGGSFRRPARRRKNSARSRTISTFIMRMLLAAGAERIEWARRAEAAALAADPRITNSDGGSFDAATGRKVLANSRGFVGSYRSSYAGVSAAPLAADENGQMQRDGWWSSARRIGESRIT